MINVVSIEMWFEEVGVISQLWGGKRLTLCAVDHSRIPFRREADAVQKDTEVLHRIAKFNKAPPPELTLEMFAAIDQAENAGADVAVDAPPPYTGGRETQAQAMKRVGSGFVKELSRLKGIFTDKLQCFIFILLAIAYMVSHPCPSPQYTTQPPDNPLTKPPHQPS